MLARNFICAKPSSNILCAKDVAATQSFVFVRPSRQMGHESAQGGFAAGGVAFRHTPFPSILYHNCFYKVHLNEIAVWQSF